MSESQSTLDLIEMDLSAPCGFSLSVSLSVCHTRDRCLNSSAYWNAFCTVW